MRWIATAPTVMRLRQAIANRKQVAIRQTEIQPDMFQSLENRDKHDRERCQKNMYTGNIALCPGEGILLPERISFCTLMINQKCNEPGQLVGI